MAAGSGTVKHAHNQWISSLSASAAFAILITLATGDLAGQGLSLVVFTTIFGGFAVIYGLLSESRLFNLAMTNGLAVYSCMYTFFVSANFSAVPDWALMAGQPIPVVGFIAGVWIHRQHIVSVVEHRESIGGRQAPRFWHWLSPLFLIGGLSFLTNAVQLSPTQIAIALISAMTAIGVIATLLSRQIAVFLIDTGMIFEGFWRGLSHITAPAFAFLTFYLLNVIAFAAIYRLIDRFSPDPHFLVNGMAQDLNFAESLYFSVATLSTAGYGDIVPLSDGARLIVTLQLIFGAVLILIGVAEILNYARHRSHDN